MYSLFSSTQIPINQNLVQVTGVCDKISLKSKEHIANLTGIFISFTYAISLNNHCLI